MIETAERLKRSIMQGRLAHGYLVTGPDADGVQTLLKECASLILFGAVQTERLEFSPDFFLLDGAANVDEIRSIRHELGKQTYSGDRRVVIVSSAHLMNDSAVNAMLKMLEEPPAGTHFLLSGIELRILPTIRSRCVIVRLGEPPRSDIVRTLTSLGASAVDAERLSFACFGSVSTAIRLFNDSAYKKLRDDAIKAFFSMLDSKPPFGFVKSIGKERASAVDSVNFMFGCCHDLLAFKSSAGADVQLYNPDHRYELLNTSSRFTFLQIGGIIDKLADAARQLTSNAGVNLTLDHMIVEIIGGL